MGELNPALHDAATKMERNGDATPLKIELARNCDPMHTQSLRVHARCGVRVRSQPAQELGADRRTRRFRGRLVKLAKVGGIG